MFNLFEINNADYQWLIDNYKNDHMLWGWFAPYPFLIFFGVIACVIACVIKFRLKRMPMADLQMGIVIIVPVGIICASFFGKLGTSANFHWKVWEFFYFWNPGMNLFGGFAGGAAAGFAYYWRKKEKRLISIWVYADCIIPNVFLAQAIGRWGNLFNHEILGKEVSNLSQINWLPEWIWHRLFYLYDPGTGNQMSEVVFHQPLFLYESIATLTMFLILTFFTANIGKFFSKKPWSVSPKAYPCLYNKNYRWMNEEDVEFIKLQSPVKYKKNKYGKVCLSFNNVWNKAYYLRDCNNQESSDAQKSINNWKATWENYIENCKKVKNKFKQDKGKLLTKYKKDKQQLKSELHKLKSSFKENLANLSKPCKNKIIHWWKTDSSSLYKINNPDNYFVINCGFNSSMYIILYSVIRFALEVQREPYEYTVRSVLWLDILLYLGIFTFGIILLVFSQFVAPKKWREESWLYEKSY